MILDYNKNKGGVDALDAAQADQRRVIESFHPRLIVADDHVLDLL